jgi:hypothetical protein
MHEVVKVYVITSGIMNYEQYHLLQKQGAKNLTIQIRKAEIKKTPGVAGANYLIVLINCTDLCIVLGRINNRGKWFAAPRVCRTSNSDPDICFNQRAWAPVLYVRCTDARFVLSLATMPDDNGNASGATWDITPNCQFAGGAIALV